MSFGFVVAVAVCNIAVGAQALYGDTSGEGSIAIGTDAGYYLTTGNNSINIGSAGRSFESHTIRIGRQGVHTTTYLAGISGAAVTGSEVAVNGSGRPGVAVSSARGKHDIHDMGAASSKLLKLRPVRFRYNNDPAGTQQYGLVAEEVEKVYPELVTYGADGKVESVRYSMLTAMLLNELKKQSSREAAQARQIRDQAQQIEKLSAQLQRQKADFDQRLAAVERVLESEDVASASAR